MTAGLDLDVLLATAAELGAQWADAARWEAGDERVAATTAAFLEVLSTGYPHGHLAAVVDAYAALGEHLPDDLWVVLPPPWDPVGH